MEGLGDPHNALGRIRTVLDMVNDPVWRMTPEKAVARLREIFAEYHAATAAPKKEGAL